MNAKKLAAVATLICALALARGGAQQTQEQDNNPLYTKMAPVEQYLMDRDAEIALARSAAPESISRDATVLILGRQGYETAVKGTNGFVCGVERAFMVGFDDPLFWNPKIRGAICYNPPAARSVLPFITMRTRLVLSGLSKVEMIDRIKAALDKKELPALEPGAMAYMLSKQAYLSEDEPHSLAHFMFYTPVMKPADWGVGKHQCPVFLLSSFQGAPEPLDIFIVEAGRWSDGTPAPVF